MDEASPRVHACIARLDQVRARHPAEESWLSRSESERLPRLRAERRRAHFLAGHWLMRELLAEGLGGSPLDWPLQQHVDQPPTLERDVFDARHLSISHSGDWLACAFSSARLGIDLEQFPRRHGLAQVSSLLAEPGEILDDDALLRRWVAKEAFIKRDVGAALPERLAQLRLRLSAPSQAAVRVWSSPQCHLALASVAPFRPIWYPSATLDEVEAWTVDDRSAA